MLRLALPLSVALLAIFGARAAGAATVTGVSGEIRALAFSGDGLVVVRLPPRGGLALERLVDGSPAQTLFSTPARDDDDEVSLAASADALAFGFKPNPSEDLVPGRVMIGPTRGPLREVATCAAGLIVSPVAVAGSRVAWREGACGEPVAAPETVSPATLVVGGADPAAPVRRMPIAVQRLPVSIVLAPGDTGLVGTLLPSFFGFDTDVRAFSPAGLGATVAAGRGRLVSPVGILADGTRVLLQSGLDDEDACDAKQLFTLAPGSSERRPVPLGGCLIGASSLGPSGATSPVASGDRIVAFLGGPLSRSGRRVTVVSVRADGSDRRALVKGGYRQPEGIATAGGKVAWWQPRCTGGREIVVQSSPEPTARLAACVADVLTRSARLRRGRIAVRLRCPAGCQGTIFGQRVALRTFSLAAGTHRLNLEIALGRRRSATVTAELAVANGPSRSVSIRVRR